MIFSACKSNGAIPRVPTSFSAVANSAVPARKGNHSPMTQRPGRWGTTWVLLADLIATLGAVAFAIIYSKDNPWVFAPVLCVTLFLSILVAILVRQSDKMLKTVSHDTSFHPRVSQP